MDLPHVEQDTLMRFSYRFFGADGSPISGDSRLGAMLCLPEDVITLVNGGLEGTGWVVVCWVTFLLFTGSAAGGASRSSLSTMGFASNLSVIA